jgi:hypothetical protein
MNNVNVHEYYDSMADVSLLTREAINNLELAREKVQMALGIMSNVKKYGSDVAISPISNVTTNDVHRNLLFFELLLNQTLGVTNTLTFQELLEITCYLSNEEDL